MKAGLALDVNSSASKGSRLLRAKVPGPSVPTTKFYSDHTEPFRQVSADLINYLIATAINWHFRSEEVISSYQRYFSCPMSILLLFNLNPHSIQCPGSQELFRFRSTQTCTQTRVSRVSRVFWQSVSAWDSNP